MSAAGGILLEAGSQALFARCGAVQREDELKTKIEKNPLIEAYRDKGL
jgi:hypothetical protein